MIGLREAGHAADRPPTTTQLTINKTRNIAFTTDDMMTNSRKFIRISHSNRRSIKMMIGNRSIELIELWEGDKRAHV